MPRRLSLLCFLLFLPLPALAQRPGPGETEVARDGAFVVYSDVAVSTSRGQTIIERVRAAWDFVAGEERWAKDACLAHDVGIRAVSDERMKEHSKKAKGIAVGKDTFLVAASFLDEERSARTLAHELTHLQDRRHLAKGARLPHWLSEAHAMESGRAYEAKLGLRDPRYEDAIATVATSVSAREARRILEEDAYLSEKKMRSVFRMEATGFFFLEFVRARFQVTDLEPRLAKVVARVGSGEALDDAFGEELPVGLEEALRAFYERLDATERKPAERLAGTALAR